MSFFTKCHPANSVILNIFEKRIATIMNTGKWDRAEKRFQIWYDNKESEERKPIPLSLKYFGIDSSGYGPFTGIMVSVFLNFRRAHSEGWKESIRAACQKFQESEKFKATAVEVLEADREYEVLYPRVPRPTPKEIREREKINRERLQGLLNHDPDLILHLYEEEFPGVVKMVLRNSGTAENARDLFQDSLIILLEKAMRNELDLICSLETYLFSVCKILWFGHLRRRKRKQRLFPGNINNEEQFLIYAGEAQPDHFEKVQKAIDALGEPCRSLLDSYYYRKMNWEDIARQLGYISAASARNQKYKCLERIRKMVREG